MQSMMKRRRSIQVLGQCHLKKESRNKLTTIRFGFLHRWSWLKKTMNLFHIKVQYFVRICLGSVHMSNINFDWYRKLKSGFLFRFLLSDQNRLNYEIFQNNFFKCLRKCDKVAYEFSFKYFGTLGKFGVKRSNLRCTLYVLRPDRFIE